MAEIIVKNILQHAHRTCSKCEKKGECSSDELIACFNEMCGFHQLRDGTMTKVKKSFYKIKK